MPPAMRLEFIKRTEKLTGEKIGHSNSKQRWDKVVNKALIKAVEEEIDTEVFSSIAEDSKKATEISFSKRKEYLKAVKKITSSVLGVDVEDIDSTSNFKDDLGADEIDTVSIIIGTEKFFGIEIEDEKVSNIKTVSNLLNIVDEKLLDSKGESKKETEDPIEVLEEEIESEIEVFEDLDLCISFDDTGSMYSVRQQVRNRINELVDRLFEDIPGLRVGIIIHNDYCDMPRHIFVQDFTNDKKKIQAFVNQNSPQGGGDAPECYELALHEATKMSWISKRRALVMIGDEVPHHVGYSYGSHTNTLDWVKETTSLSMMGVKVYGVQALGRRHSTNFYETISRISNGVKLDLSQFQHIPTYINAIAYHQAGQLEAYQASDPSFDTNLALKNMFNKLKGGSGTISSEKIELLSKFQVMTVGGSMEIREFVEANGCTFQRGKGYYQLIERTADGKANSEIVQANKEVLFVNKETGETISDTNWCREKLGVPYGVKATVRPLSIPDVMEKYDVFIQSNSYNRKLDPGTKFLYELDAR